MIAVIQLIVLRGAAFLVILAVIGDACGKAPAAPSGTGGTGGSVPPSAIASDADLFALVTQSQPFQAYARFPNLDASPSGILAASSAHQPSIRVSLNAVAASALQNGGLPAGSSFPNGSIIFKEVIGVNGTANLYAVMYKDLQNSFAGSGWLWAELRPTGEAEYSLRNRGNACTGCHSAASRSDFVRIFERQR